MGEASARFVTQWQVFSIAFIVVWGNVFSYRLLMWI